MDGAAGRGGKSMMVTAPATTLGPAVYFTDFLAFVFLEMRLATPCKKLYDIELLLSLLRNKRDYLVLTKMES